MIKYFGKLADLSSTQLSSLTNGTKPFGLNYMEGPTVVPPAPPSETPPYQSNMLLWYEYNRVGGVSVTAGSVTKCTSSSSFGLLDADIFGGAVTESKNGRSVLASTAKNLGARIIATNGPYSQWTVFSVVKMAIAGTAFATYEQMAYAFGETGNHFILRWAGNVSNSLDTVAISQGGDQARYSYPGISDYGWKIISMTMNGNINTSRIWMNGNEATQVPSPTSAVVNCKISNYPTDFGGGGYNASVPGQNYYPPQEYFSGSIAETIVYNEVMSDANRQLIEGYLNTKWSIY